MADHFPCIFKGERTGNRQSDADHIHQPGRTYRDGAGAVGGGGLGDFAIRYGHSRGQTDVTYATVIIILIMVSLIQSNRFVRY